jgi:type III restriction enzyme
MPKKGRGRAGGLDPLSLPAELLTALEALYGHYAKTFELWQEEGIGVPPVFIVVCNNTSTSKLVYDYVSGFLRENDDATTTLENGRLELFRNYDEHGNRLPRPRTLLIDSEQLEAGEALDKDFPPWPPTRSSASAARSSSGRGRSRRPTASPTRSCCAR